MLRTAEWIAAHKTQSQAAVYRSFNGRLGSFRWLFRLDVRYRCRRLVAVAKHLGIDLMNKRVLDVGFGGGQKLRCFPKSCCLHGAEVSQSAVTRAKQDSRYRNWQEAAFTLIPEEPDGALPRGPFDILLSSHTLEHVIDDRAFLDAARSRLTPDGIFFLFVPIEEPHYNPDHLRSYSVDSIRALVTDAGFEVRSLEESMHINGHIWKTITIPSRRRWPVLKGLVDAVRLVTLSALTYPGQRILDKGLAKLGVGPRQAFLVCGVRPCCESGDGK